jgi:hypothetical protein
MKRLLLVFALLLLPVLAGCGGSPYEDGKAFAKKVSTTLESGDAAKMQKLAQDAEAKAKSMTPTDAEKFMKGYHDEAMKYMQSLQSKMPKLP